MDYKDDYTEVDIFIGEIHALCERFGYSLTASIYRGDPTILVSDTRDDFETKERVTRFG